MLRLCYNYYGHVTSGVLRGVHYPELILPPKIPIFLEFNSIKSFQRPALWDFFRIYPKQICGE